MYKHSIKSPRLKAFSDDFKIIINNVTHMIDNLKTTDPRDFKKYLNDYNIRLQEMKNYTHAAKIQKLIKKIKTI